MQTLEAVLRDWAKGLRTVRRRVIMLVSYHGLVVRLLTWPHWHDLDGVIRPGGRATPSPS